MTPHALEVTGGQDRGARFSLRPGDTSLGRGGQMDLMLTDPALEKLHARLHLGPDRLVLHDLSGGATRLNGAPLDGPRPLSVGDRLGMGSTELTVLWTPGASAPEPRREERPPAAVPPPTPEDGAEAAAEPAGDGRADDEPALDMEVPAAGIALALSLLALVSTWLPFLGRADGSVASVWTLGSDGLAVQSIVVAVLAIGMSLWWLVDAMHDGGPFAYLAPVGVSLLGAAVAGLPLFAIAVNVASGSRDVGVFVMLVSGVGAMAVAAVGVSDLAAEVVGDAPHPGAIVAAIGAGLGGLIAAVSAPLPWLAGNLVDWTGLDPALRVGRLTLPIGLLVAVVAGGALLAPLLGRRRLEFPLALGAAALAMTGLTLTTATVTGFSGLSAQSGLVLTFAGMTLAAAAATVGALWMTRPPPGQPVAPGAGVAGS